MSDRELLELAAKAAGWVKWDSLPAGPGINVYDAEGRHAYFDPLTDDGDALRLAVKLRITIQWSATVDDFSPSVEVYHAEDVHSECIEVKTGHDPYAATRRAIVRAAAEIGRLMQ